MRRGDLVALGVLLVLPVALFVVPSLFSHPAIGGDNLIQNYPLRVLVGRDLRAGLAPTWNPLADSGTPLLAGMNAGAAYPLTWLFAVLPALAAWNLNLLAVYWLAGIGTYVLVRRLGAGTLGAAGAAVTYAYAGAMVGQLVHLGVVQGQAWLPWLVLAQLSLSRAVLGTERGAWRAALARAAPATLGLAFVVAMVCLTGEPRSIADAQATLVVVGLVELVAHGSVRAASALGRALYVALSALGVLWGLALGAIQLVPAESFISLSERASVPYSFFAAGSLPTGFLSLLLAPGLLGSNGAMGTQTYFAWYNLPEVTGYAGVLALTGAAAFLGQLLARRSRAARRRYLPFLALVVAGAVLALGSSTPLGGLEHLVPGLGATRLQSRSIVLLDLGAAVLLGWWLDALARGHRERASLTGWRTALSAAPAALGVVLCISALGAPSWVTERLLDQKGTAALAPGIRATVAVSLGAAVAALLVVLVGRARPARAARWLMVVMVADLVGFNVFFQSGFPVGLRGEVPDAAVALRALGAKGRVALVDPGVRYYAQIARLATPNLNVFTLQRSVQGYGSLVAQRYYSRTGVRFFGNLDGCALARGEFAPLGLRTIGASPNALAVTRWAPPAAPRCAPRGARPSSTRYLGPARRARVVTMVAATGHPFVAPTLSFLGPSGAPRSVRAQVNVRTSRAGASVLRAVLPDADLIAAVSVRQPGGVRLASTTVEVLGAKALRLDTSLQVGLDTGGWRLLGTTGAISVFRTAALAPELALAPARTSGASGGPPRASLSVLDSRDGAGGLTATVSVGAPSLLVRAEAWLPGWTATITRAGRTSTVRVVPHGLVQAVAVPAGTSTVSFRYEAPGLRTGTSLSALAALGWALAALVTLRARRRAVKGTARRVR